MLEPKEVVVNGKNFTIHKFPAIEGREIICNYPLTSIPKVGEYKQNEAIMLKLMKYVSVKSGGTTIVLDNPVIVDSHARDWETLMKLEAAVLEYNCSFFQKGLVSTFLQDIAQKLPQWISKILTASLDQSSPKEKPPTES